MRKHTVLLLTVLFFGLILTACSPGEEAETPMPTGFPGAVETGAAPTEALPDTGGTVELPLETEMIETPETTEPVDLVTGTPPAGETATPELRGAEIIPATGRDQATQLSNLMNYRVVNAEGTGLGAVEDYILNMCEAHILYIVLEPAAGQESASSAQTTPVAGSTGLVLVPYEVVTLGGGSIDIEQQAIVMNVDANQLSDAPAFEETPDLTTTEWEQEVRAYWTEIVTLSNLTSACRVSEPGTTTTPQAGEDLVTVTLIGYASQVLEMELHDGIGNLLGNVEEVVQEPESGHLRYLLIRLDDSFQPGGELVLVPLRAVNIRQSQTEDARVLELLVENAILENAPRLDTGELPAGADWQEDVVQYWSQHVPLTEESQP